VRLRTDQAGADAFYRSLGFVRCTEPGAAHVIEFSGAP
jgi:hypothetical protein